MTVLLTDWLVRVIRTVVNADNEHQHNNIDDARVEVGHVERGAKTSDGGIGSYDARY